MEYKCKNPCGEVPLGEYMPVMPWVQAQMMQMLREKNGWPLYKPDEIESIIKHLENQQVK